LVQDLPVIKHLTAILQAITKTDQEFDHLQAIKFPLPLLMFQIKNLAYPSFIQTSFDYFMEQTFVYNLQRVLFI